MSICENCGKSKDIHWRVMRDDKCEGWREEKSMELEEQVCSLELAKKLRELGVKQRSLWAYEVVKKQGVLFTASLDYNHPVDWVSYANTYNYKPEELCPTFTVAELGEMFAESVYLDGDTYYLKGYNNAVVYHYDIRYDTRADARAKMLIYLIEKGVVKP